ncbi:hypothetical protein BDK61_2672 [Haloarcula quadrata]|uniref:DUF2634 domain-containing protein n=1 Tax=Haloarcula quadrata TaxID=182779 RepID=A0A495R7V5_9EURY|nr:DUF2634 domain-containing protein [Haloarcula quadrata]RKS83329.1 hypothetical protein BDK61_2672 [Haloarcula quadrata]
MKYNRTLALEEDGSYRVENGELVWIDGAAAVEQELKTTLATVRGEDPFDEDHGLRVFEAAGSAPPILEREIRDALLEDDRVEAVDEIVITDPDANRRVDVAISVTLVDGTGLDFETEVTV